ncbi:DUF3304 domain-containing protein [Chromobacterium sp. IIBBL 290-4]|uniref:DUF3304 domain-containing protein n=1 Tax=Chromobacterium sp. IIBBL 290-4 TaxID=2953890 RepID=UPI0020B6AB30|nr:DUF3304 domain-containing protein [Chromobacterium sp. IIBBL 290-4]UTH76618.1 DUF3304 domain-containing protein [Chromobacterium sp. IIBBL 290-4]
MQKRWLTALILSMLALLAGCQSLAGEEMKGVPARVVNADKSIRIIWATFNGQGVSGGGGDECCINIPKKWQPGMTAEITWKKDPSPKKNPDGSSPPPWKNGEPTREWDEWMRVHQENYKTMNKIINVPKYDRTCGVTFIFLPCDDPRVIIDCDQDLAIMNNLPGGEKFDSELIRRLGGRQSCR